ncbi:MAG TPA: right-handed parallel beta-helix repeat-containing protein [Candidatus Methylacidiphilales bacterium]|nr:right-handed parallel beta-helix repeat-containing protein [Candidatus Methylacidiphilales bacterium]
MKTYLCNHSYLFLIQRLAVVAVIFGGTVALRPLIAGPAVSTIYVAPDGNDQGDGSQSNPFATPLRARDAVRETLRRGVGAEVILRGGTYQLAEPLSLGTEDSGTERLPVLWRAADGETVRISAGREVKVTGTGAAIPEDALKRIPEAVRERVMYVDLRGQGITDYGEMSGGFGKKGSPGLEVFVDDQPTWPARYPDKGFITITEVVGPTPVDIRGTKGTAEGIFRVEDKRVANWKDEKDARVMGYWFWDWAEEHQKIAKIDPETLTITLAEPWHKSGYQKKQYFYAYNVLSELDQPGEWYLDRADGKLYLLAPSADPRKISVTLLPSVLLLKNASHITFYGLTIEGARKHAVVMKDSTGSSLKNCTVRNSGQWAVHIEGGAKCSVLNCDISGTGDGGVSLVGGDRKTLTAAGHLVEKCSIHHYSRWTRTYQPGIRLEGVGNVARGNLIYDAPHQGIAFGGNDQLMELNEIHHVCQETNDAGAIYAWNDWAARGNVIRYNYLHHVNGKEGKGAHGVYLDDGFSNAQITGNVFQEVAGAVLLGGGRDIQLTNNLFVHCVPKVIQIDARGLDWRAFGFDELKQKLEQWPYKSAPWSTRYPELPAILDENPMTPKGVVVSRNITVDGGKNDLHNNALPWIKIENNLFTAPPEVLSKSAGPGGIPQVDTANDKVKELGFEPVPWTPAGHQSKD